MQNDQEGHRPSTAFDVYLRTGRRVMTGQLEVKFNPWHDEENGRFTFAGQGRYFAGGSSSEPSDIPALRHNDPWSRPDSEWAPDRSHLRADYPNNYSIFIVERGDTLSDIARRRKGLTARDLAWLNKHPIDKPLQIGQRIKVPKQAYLDAGRVARGKFLGLAYYMDTHGGKLPPDPSNPPSLESQILDTNWRRESKNGYNFQIDIIARRSRRNQAAAGKPDRRPTDDGGHFIAARFNGPGDSFNLFAQDANFNRGAYRAMEDDWAKTGQAGNKILVHIVPHYKGRSMRPDRIRVTWTINGKTTFKIFPNEAKDRRNGQR